MTAKEKENHKLIKDTRLSRIAKGSGTKESDVRDFITKFEQMQGMMVNMMGAMKGGGMPNLPGMPPMPGHRQVKGTHKKKKSGKGTKGGFGRKFF